MSFFTFVRLSISFMLKSNFFTKASTLPVLHIFSKTQILRFFVYFGTRKNVVKLLRFENKGDHFVACVALPVGHYLFMGVTDQGNELK